MIEIRKKKVDEDWKNQAETEKAKIAGIEQEETDELGKVPEGALSLTPIFEQLAAQAMAGLGQVPDPRTGMRNVDLEMARYAIDLLGSLEAKTKGRLSREEDQVLKELLSALRTGFVQMQQQAAAPPPPPPEEPK